jgi:hypothetical protein
LLVFWKERLVLLAVPKTGTTALQRALGPKASMVMRDPPTLKHTPVYRYKRFVEPMFGQAGGEGFETVAAIRQPVEWLSSWYRYRHRDDLAGHPNSTRGVSFDDFVTEYTKGKPAPYAALGSQARFVQGKAGEIGVTHLFRYEQQDRLFAFLEERLQVKIDLQRMNVSPEMAVGLSAEVEALYRRRCADEFAVWEAAGRG